MKYKEQHRETRTNMERQGTAKGYKEHYGETWNCTRRLGTLWSDMKQHRETRDTIERQGTGQRKKGYHV